MPIGRFDRLIESNIAFDPRLVDIFIKYNNEFNKIFLKHQEDNIY